MNTIGRAFAIITIWVATSLAWLVLGGVMTSRVHDASRDMASQVEGLWGRPQVQQAPTATLWPEGGEEPDGVAAAPPIAPVGTAATPAVAPGPSTTAPPGGASQGPAPLAVVQPSSTAIEVDLHLDQRLKGLRWFSLYDVSFGGRWTFRHDGDEPARMRLGFTLPDEQGVFDDVRFVVDGAPVEVTPEHGRIAAEVLALPGQEIVLEVGYASRGQDSWHYAPTTGGASVLRDFSLVMRTDFDDVDFPQGTLSPSDRKDAPDGLSLGWEFSRIVTGAGIGMAMPQRVQPGELAAALAFSAPISLGFFFVVIALLARLRGLDIHPINYVLVSGAFFAFHLLFAYAVDHLHVGVAFALSSVTSVCMVTAYLRLVVSTRFAFVEAAGAQLLYLIGFSLAHFLEGFTGLTVTVLSIATLFLLMMLTGRIRWSRVLAKAPPPPPPMPGAMSAMGAAAGPGPMAAAVVPSPYDVRPG